MIASVRKAKAKLSELLDRAAKGEEVVITSDGRAKARLVAVREHLPYRVNRTLLRRRTRRGSTTADAIVREERDSRD
jgi:prevent-host-death family protein